MPAVRALAAVGANEYEIAKFLGVTEQTMLNWKAEHPEFFGALKVGAEAAVERMTRSVFMRGSGFTRTEKRVALCFGRPVKYEVEVYYPPEPGSAKLFLTNKDPLNWREKRAVEVYTPAGEAVRTYAATSDELVETYGQRIARAAEDVPEEAADPDSDVAGDLGRDGREEYERGGDEGIEPMR